MSVEFIPATKVHELTARLEAARAAATPAAAAPPGADTAFWEGVFEANAAAVLAALGHVHLPPEYVVRYRYYGQRGGDLLVRPFVARTQTDVQLVRSFIDWHPAPDSTAALHRSQPTRDVELLYRHFRFDPSALGYFAYWLAMQELWASARWVHSRVLAEADEFQRLAGQAGWQVQHAVERYEPAVVVDAAGAQLAVLIYCPLEREHIALHQIRIGADQDVRVVDVIPVASGPRGYVMR